MWVYVLLAVLAAAFGLVILGFVVWALTRPSDRIQMATLCLFLCTLQYFATAWQLFSVGGPTAAFGLALAVYALGVYVAMAVLAIYYRRWAWWVGIGAFAVHLLGGLFVALPAMSRGPVALVGLALWFVAGGVGLWACTHSGSRALITASNAGHA